MPEKNLLTQSQLIEINEVLANIVKNINYHTNDNLSSAHAINAEIRNYFDSGGDLIGNIVLRIAFGSGSNSTIVYVPGTITTFSGSIVDVVGVDRSTDKPYGTDASSGIPPKNVSYETQFSETLLQKVKLLNLLIIAHSKMSPKDEFHIGIRLSSKINYDSVGHRVGRHAVTIFYGNKSYELPADVRPDGPPLKPRFAPGYCMDYVTGTRNNFPAPCNLYDKSKDGQSGGVYVFRANFLGGTPPVNYKFQISTVRDVWVDAENDILYNSRANIFQLFFHTSHPTSGTIPSNPYVDIKFEIEHTSRSSDKTESDAFKIRCCVSNESGESYTSPLTISAKDETGCVLVSTALRNGWLTVDDLKNTIRYRIHSQKNDLFGDQIWIGYKIGFRYLKKLGDNYAIFNTLVINPYTIILVKLSGNLNLSAKEKLILFIGRIFCIAVFYLFKSKSKKILEDSKNESLLASYKSMLSKHKKK